MTYERNRPACTPLKVGATVKGLRIVKVLRNGGSRFDILYLVRYECGHEFELKHSSLYARRPTSTNLCRDCHTQKRTYTYKPKGDLERYWSKEELLEHTEQLAWAMSLWPPVIDGKWWAK